MNNFPKEKTCNWPKAPGPKGPKRNKVGFHEVKVAAAQDMADDIYGNGPATIGLPIGVGAGLPLPPMGLPRALRERRRGGRGGGGGIGGIGGGGGGGY